MGFPLDNLGAGHYRSSLSYYFLAGPYQHATAGSRGSGLTLIVHNRTIDNRTDSYQYCFMGGGGGEGGEKGQARHEFNYTPEYP